MRINENNNLKFKTIKTWELNHKKLNFITGIKLKIKLKMNSMSDVILTL